MHSKKYKLVLLYTYVSMSSDLFLISSSIQTYSHVIMARQIKNISSLSNERKEATPVFTTILEI